MPNPPVKPALPAHAVTALAALLVFLAATAITVGVASPVAAAPRPSPSATHGIVHVATTPAPTPTRTPSSAPPLISYSTSWLSGHGSPQIDGVQAQSAILVDLDRHQVLWARSADQARATASLAKIVTVLVALDHAPLERVVTVPASAVDNDPQHTTMGLNAGDQVTVRELLYGIFLVSGNDAAETLAQTLEPRDRFIADMNAKAAALGMRSSHFANPTGLDDPGETSTAYDLALATGYFAEHHYDLLALAQQPQVWLYANPGHPEYDLVNLNKLILWPYPGATGLKTGYTWAAGGCVAATAERYGRHLVAVVLGSDVMFSDAAALFDYGWSVTPA